MGDKPVDDMDVVIDRVVQVCPLHVLTWRVVVAQPSWCHELTLAESFGSQEMVERKITAEPFALYGHSMGANLR